MFNENSDNNSYPKEMILFKYLIYRHFISNHPIQVNLFNFGFQKIHPEIGAKKITLYEFHFLDLPGQSRHLPFLVWMIIIEPKILKELKNGDHAAFEEVFNRFSKQLFLFSLKYLKSEEAAEDIVQEVFIKIWDNRKDIKTDTSFQSYLFTITLNAIRKYFNRLSRLNELKHDILFDLSGMKAEFDDRSNYQFLLDKLEELVSQMPEKRREVFIKKKIEEKSLKEISEELNITTKTVEYHIAEAMKFLKNEFEKLQIQGLIFFHLFIS